MSRLKCVVIEDQIPAQETLQNFIGQTPQLQLLSTFISPIEALPILESGDVDVMFLDVHLPKLTGIELLRCLKSPPQTIVTTAFSKYALDGFELDVVDYLLKPFSFERFLKAVAKVQKNSDPNQTADNPCIFVRNKGQIKKIILSEIETIESKGDFIILCTETSREIANTSLGRVMKSLGDNFVRCHKSYVVNINYIERIIGNHMIVRNKEIPIGRTYKEQLLKKIEVI